MRGKDVDRVGLTMVRRYDRRAFLGLGGAAIAAAGTIAIVGRSGSAHDDHPSSGGTPEASPQASPAASPVVAASEFQVNTVDLAFQPAELTIPAHTAVTIRVENLGAIPHDFTCDELGVTSGNLGGGESATVTIDAAPGTYGYYCSVPGHKQAGMRGTLTVE